MFLNKEICSKCKGECCRKSGCFLSTRDIKEFDDVKRLLAEKSIVICSIPYNIFILHSFNIQDPLLDLYALRDDKDLIKARSLKKYRNVYIIKTRSENQGIFEEIDDPNHVAEHLASGKCVFLTPNGCRLSDVQRPFGGLQLEPDARGIKYCKLHFSIVNAALEWFEYHEELNEIIGK